MAEVIKETRDYKLFKLLDSNREIDEGHVKDLMSKMKNDNLLEVNPIQVNEQFQVIDGQHRLKAAEKLGIPVYYVQSPRLREKHIINLNITKKTWSLADYMHHHCTKQKPEYLKLQKFIEENDISLNLAIALCDHWRSAKAIQRFRDGDFVFNEAFGKELIEKANAIIELIKQRIGFKPFLRSTSFFKAICVMLGTANIDHQLFYQKIEMQLPKIGHQTSVKLYCDMFLEIYNYKMKNKVSIDEIVI